MALTASLLLIIISQCSAINFTNMVEEGVDTNMEKVKVVLPVCSESSLSGNELEMPGIWLSTNKSTIISVTVADPDCRSREPLAVEWKLDNENNNSIISHFYPNGYFRYQIHMYAPDEYCIESVSEFKIQIRHCTPDCGVGKRRPCIMKCCPLDKIFSGFRGRQFCVFPPSQSREFMPPLYHDYNTRVELVSNLSELDEDEKPKSRLLMPHFIINHPKVFKENCKNSSVLPHPHSDTFAAIFSSRFAKDYHSTAFHIRTDGALMYRTMENKRCEAYTRFDNVCVDGVRAALSNDAETPFNNTEDEYIMFQCGVDERDPHADKYLSFTFGILLLVTSIFPLMTSVVYILLWRRQNIHGWTIAATSGSLCLFYIFQGTAHIIRITLQLEALNTFYCQLIGIVTHFFMMATFTWLTVMSCDLWLTFRSVTPMNHRLQGVTRYLQYSAFGWGVPTIIVTVGVLMDYVLHLVSASNCSYHIIPGYGQQSCWIAENALGEYLYYPAGVLLCVNITLFTATCTKLCRYGRGPSIRTKKNDQFGECFSRFAKLFCVMGVSWIFEIVSWYVHGLGYFWYWNILDIFNILRAVAVFVVYVCKQDILIQLEESYPPLKRMSASFSGVLGVFRPFGNLFMRKCSDEISRESTMFSALPSSSPVIPMKALRQGCESSEGTKRMGDQLDVPQTRM